MKQLDLDEMIDALISGDSCTEAKPSSKPLWLAAQHLSCQPENIFFLGDHPRDAQAANAAGMHSVAVSWGFKPPEEDIETWGADHVIDEPEDLIAIITSEYE